MILLMLLSLSLLSSSLSFFDSYCKDCNNYTTFLQTNITFLSPAFVFDVVVILVLLVFVVDIVLRLILILLLFDTIRIGNPKRLLLLLVLFFSSSFSQNRISSSPVAATIATLTLSTIATTVTTSRRLLPNSLFSFKSECLIKVKYTRSKYNTVAGCLPLLILSHKKTSVKYQSSHYLVEFHRHHLY